MQKIVALVALRRLRRGDKDFRRWFARRVCAILRHAQYPEAVAFHDHQLPSVYVDTIRRNVMFQLQFCVPFTRRRIRHHSDVRLYRVPNRSGYCHWVWRRVQLQKGF